jgi:hypothetical protein
VGEQRWFYRNTQEWQAIVERLKLTPCPHCKTVGSLIRHGFLYGFDDSNTHRKTLRARRILCSNRHARHGCGRTFSVWLADKIRRLGLTTTSLWRFLQHALAHGIRAASRASAGHLSDRSWLRIWQRFNLGQSKIRTALLGCCPMPELPASVPSLPSSTPSGPSLSKPSDRPFANDNADLPHLSPRQH